jgi:hypothetical protein
MLGQSGFVVWKLFDNTMSFIPKGREQWVQQARGGALIIALPVWLWFFLDGISTGFGIYRHPASCWIAAGVALLAAVATRSMQRWLALLALALAVGGALYGYRKNAGTREWWQRFEARQHEAGLSQPNTSK